MLLKVLHLLWQRSGIINRWRNQFRIIDWHHDTISYNFGCVFPEARHLQIGGWDRVILSKHGTDVLRFQTRPNFSAFILYIILKYVYMELPQLHSLIYLSQTHAI